MAQLVRELMTADPVTLPGDAGVREAAQAMRERDVGDVLVVDDGELRGIVTDRDIVVRCVAEHDDVSGTRLRNLCSGELVTAAPEEAADTAIGRMREHAVRRIPVVEDGRPVGVFSLGDAAIERDPGSALADVSAARGNA